MPKQITDLTKKWYVLHTYSGYEDNVARNLKQRIESMGMEDKIFNVLVPKETKIKIKNGKRKTVEERIFPGYVLVEMVVTDDSCTDDSQCPSFCTLNQEPEACICHADIDKDNKVALADLLILKTEFSVSCPPSPCSADINDDGKVDLTDLLILKTEFFRDNCTS